MKNNSINLVYEKKEFKGLQINLNQLEHITGLIQIKHSVFYDCYFTISYVDFQHIDVILTDNRFINCTFDMRFSEITGHKITLTNSAFKNSHFSFYHNRFYNPYLEMHHLKGLDELRFIKCIFNSYITFEESEIKHMILIKCMFENDVDLRLNQSEEISVESCKISKLLNLYFFNDANIQRLNLYDNINLGEILIDWHKHHVKERIKTQKHHYELTEDSMNQMPVNRNFYANQFILLKENFRKQGHYSDEDLAYFEYRKHLSKKSVYSIIGGFVGKYGTHPIQIFQYMIGVIIIFSFLFYLIEIRSLNQFLILYPKYLYFSGITFLTIGYSDVLIESTVSQILTLVEAFMGLFLMAYFTGSFIRKVLR